MSDAELQRKQELELRIDRTLATSPRVIVPEDFAARVAAQAKSIRPPLPATNPERVTGVGSKVMWAIAALLLVVILVLAPGASYGMRFWVAFALELDFAALALALSLRGLRA